jgi:hypothetical protein
MILSEDLNNKLKLMILKTKFSEREREDWTEILLRKSRSLDSNMKNLISKTPDTTGLTKHLIEKGYISEE